MGVTPQGPSGICASISRANPKATSRLRPMPAGNSQRQSSLPSGKEVSVMESKITLIYVDSGGGHRAAATALSEMIRRQNRPSTVNMVSHSGR